MNACHYRKRIISPSSSFLKKFLKKCGDAGIELLEKDTQFIDDFLKLIPYNKREEVLNHYIETWQRIMGECGSAVAAENLGRRAANMTLWEWKK